MFFWLEDLKFSWLLVYVLTYSMDFLYRTIFESVASWHVHVLLQCVSVLKYNKNVNCLDHWELSLSVYHNTLIFIIVYTCKVKIFYIPNECVLNFFLDILQNKLIINTKTLLKEAAEREQRLLTENQDLKQKVGQRSYNPVIDWGTVTLW